MSTTPAQINNAVPEIDGYTDLAEIGRGGFAVVYKARQLSVGRDVAIKLLTDPSPDDDLIRRFQRESRAVGALSWHPHIAAVVDAGSTSQGQAFIVFELLPGGSLEDRLQDAPLRWQEAVASMIQVADACEAAHRADVLHRDIKPANILLNRLGDAKLGDFGIASMQDGTKTETGMLATTVAHAAPELFDGRPSSAATDIYALGSTLHTLVTGSPPFAPAPGERIATTIAQIVHTPPPRPDVNIVPAEVSTVIAHALAKQPEYRPRSAAAFGKALQQAQRSLDERVTAMPVSDAGPAPVKPSTESTSAAVRATNKMVPDDDKKPSKPAAAPAVPQVSAAVEDNSETRHVPFVATDEHASPASGSPSTGTASNGPKAFSRTIVALAAIAALMVVILGPMIFFELRSEPSAIAETIGGAKILTATALPATEMDPPFHAIRAVDKDATTQWGIAPAPDGTRIAGSSYLIELTEEQTIVSVGIMNPNRTELGRVTGVIWGTGFDDDGQIGPLVTQELENDGGTFPIPYSATTKFISLTLTGVYDDAPNAGIGEILIEVAQDPGDES